MSAITPEELSSRLHGEADVPLVVDIREEEEFED